MKFPQGFSHLVHGPSMKRFGHVQQLPQRNPARFRPQHCWRSLETHRFFADWSELLETMCCAVSCVGWIRLPRSHERPDFRVAALPDGKLARTPIAFRHSLRRLCIRRGGLAICFDVVSATHLLRVSSRMQFLCGFNFRQSKWINNGVFYGSWSTSETSFVAMVFVQWSGACFAMMQGVVFRAKCFRQLRWQGLDGI